MLQLNPAVGVAPGTTTMTLGDPGDCPPDEPWQFVNPPVMAEGPPPGMSGLGRHRWDPYTDWPSLRGASLGQTISDTRWSFVIVAGIAAFAVTFGLLYLRRKK